MKIVKLISIPILLLQFQLLQAQIDTSFQRSNLLFNQYLQLVSSQNLGYAAEKFNINISEAAVERSKIFQDPTFAFDWTEGREAGVAAGHSFSTELSKTVELNGKRRARIDLAVSESELSKALVLDYFRNLQAEAAIVYLEALKQNYLFRVKIDSYRTIKQLSVADSIRFSLGNIMEIDAAQSKVEAGILLNELLQAEAEYKNSLSQISYMLGVEKTDTLFFPTGNLDHTIRAFQLYELVTAALNNRADLLAAMANVNVSQKALKLVRKERRMDVDLRLAVENAYLPSGGSPASTGITAGLAIPLKFSNLNRGDIKIAQYQVSQAEELYKQVELQIKMEITQAVNLYNAYCKQVDSFERGLLSGAGNVKKGKIYSYERGETSLLEVLNAQRTYNEIQSAYYEALYNRAAALVELEKAAGIWDINL